MVTVEAEIMPDGTVTLLEPVKIRHKSRAIVTVIENGGRAINGNVGAVLELIESTDFKNRRSYPIEEIKEHIEEARNSMAFAFLAEEEDLYTKDDLKVRFK